MNGEELRVFRKSLNLSQKDFSEVMGVKSRTIWGLEKSENIGILYTNAVRFLMIQQKSEQLKSLQAGSDELLGMMQ